MHILVLVGYTVLLQLLDGHKRLSQSRIFIKNPLVIEIQSRKGTDIKYQFSTQID